MSFKALVTQNERGRSMVEILGVLAIIGVLSIGGIQGYKYAMDKHRANDIVHSVNMRATDIWHLYQDGKKELPDSPETDAFPEYGEMTQTGFPIMVTAHPDANAFKTWVDNVPSDVCKKVLQEDLNKYIQGLRFVHVDNSSGFNRYENDIAICGNSNTVNQLIFSSFLDEEVAMTNETCVDEDDCSSACGVLRCDTTTMTCVDSCSDTDTPYCKETESGGVCVKCKERSHCLDLGENYTCSDLTNECVEVPAKCVEGKEFRTKNGICVACDNASNFMVGLDKFAVEELGIEDDLTGLEQCDACADPNTRYSGTVDEETAYCSYACTKGYSFQTTNNGCVSCTDTGGYVVPNMTTDSVSAEQCLACKDHFWYQSPKYSYQYYCDTDRCKEKEEFAHFYSGVATCESCETAGCFLITRWRPNSMNDTNFFKNKCLACGNRFVSEDNCCKKCEQPEDAEAQIEICKANPKDEKCTRKWENTSGECMSCSDSGTNTFVGTDAVEGGADANGLGALCRACGRTVTDEGFCVSSGGCNEGEFLGVDGICYKCNNKGAVRIKSSDDKDSGCIGNCQNVTDNKWYKGRRIIEVISSTKETQYYCYRNPYSEEGIWQSGDGTLYECSSLSYGDVFIKEGWPVISTLSTECTSRCNRNGVVRELTGKYNHVCAIRNCPVEINGVRQFQIRTGTCKSCNTDTAELLEWENTLYPTRDSYPDRIKERITLCESCGNRVFVNEMNSLSEYNPVCVIADPGHSGICNNINTIIPDNLNSDLKDDALEYMNANTGLFRSGGGKCYSCSEKANISTTAEQCESCPNRRYQKPFCIYGLCEEKSQFLNASNSCVACTNKNVAVNPKKENLCSSCDNRRMLTTGFEEQGNLAGLCVEECAPGLWQGKNGSCYYDNDPNTYEIGTDLESRNLCIAVDREIVEIVDKNDKVVGYECKPKSS